jgi:hypothetical protein
MHIDDQLKQLTEILEVRNKGVKEALLDIRAAKEHLKEMEVKLNGIEVPPELQKEIEELREKLNSAFNLLKGL